MVSGFHIEDGDILAIGGTTEWARSLPRRASLAHLTAVTGTWAAEEGIVTRPIPGALPYPAGFYRRIHCDMETAGHLLPEAFELLSPGGVLIPRYGTPENRDGAVMLSENVSKTGQEEDCVFCGRFRFRMNQDAGVPGAAALLWGDEFLWCAPDLAPLTEGHLLLVSTRHFPCFGACPPGLAREVARRKREVTRWLEAVYGRPVTVFEHGPAGPHGAGSCIDHAHLHFLPGAGPVRAGIEREALSGASAGPAELFRSGVSYLYLEDAEGTTTYPCPGSLPTQFLRMCAAPPGERWRWQDIYGLPETRERFMATLRKLLPSAEAGARPVDSSQRSSRAVSRSPKPMGSETRS